MRGKKPFPSRRPVQRYTPGKNRPQPRLGQARPQVARPVQAPTNWDNVAGWYDKLVGDDGSDYHRNVLLPAALRLLQPRPQDKMLDLCCGQGVFCRLLAEQGVAKVVGVDASTILLDAAKARGAAANVEYVLGDARNLGPIADGSFDGAACLMAVQDLDNVAALFKSMAAALKPGGRAVIIMMHPCFRIPRQTSWGWDEKLKIQYRRIDRYASDLQIPIATHPGSDPTQHTHFFHRPLAAYISAFGQADLGVVGCEELVSHRQSEPGGRSRAENRSRSEFPIFLALKAVKLKT